MIAFQKRLPRLCAIFIFFSPLALSAQEIQNSRATVAALDSFIQRCVSDFEIPSLAIGVVDQGKVVLVKGYWKRSEETPLAPDGNTMYAIASLSKAFTSASIAMLVDEGKLRWDDPVIKHLPWFQMHDSAVTKQMTIEDLLCHRSGLETFDGDLLWYGTNYTRNEAVERIRHYPPTYGFRTDFGYQNLMFITAGEVIETVSGMSWDRFVTERILKPLEMTRTTPRFNEFWSDLNKAKPYIHGKEILMLSYDNSGATAALNSTVNDMVRWMNFWLNDCVVGSDTLISVASRKKIGALHTSLPLGNFDQQNNITQKGYGLGWFVLDYQGRAVMHHGGGLPGYISKIALGPEEDLGLIVLTNDMNSVPSMMMYATLDWAAGQDYKKWSPIFLEMKKKGEERDATAMSERLATKKANPSLLPLEKYLGTYNDPSYGLVRVSMGADGLIFSMLPAKELFTGALSPWGDHRFRFDHNDPFLTYGILTFSVENGIVSGITMDLPNDDFHFQKLKFKRVDEG